MTRIADRYSINSQVKTKVIQFVTLPFFQTKFYEVLNPQNNLSLHLSHNIHDQDD